MSKPLIAAVFLLLAAAESAAAGKAPGCLSAEARAFSVLPLIQSAGRGDRKAAPYCVANLRPETVEVRSGEGEPWPIPVKAAGFGLAARGAGNYHWLQAREETPEGIVTAATVHYFANPGPAPTALLLAAKSELEIVPQPLPREHWRYRAGETWKFLVRFNGQPLPSAKLRLETSGGTQQVFTADDKGVVPVTFPNDFAAEKRPDNAGHAHGRGAENRFVLAMGHTDPQGRYFLSTFNYRYGEPADKGKSYLAGAGFLLLGGLIGLPLVLTRRKETVHG